MRKIFRYALVLALFALPVLAFSQNDPDPTTNQDPAGYDPPPGGGDPGAPIDSGVTILIAAGVGYGVKKWKEARKRGGVGDKL